jgi:hypothetical protein
MRAAAAALSRWHFPLPYKHLALWGHTIEAS